MEELAAREPEPGVYPRDLTPFSLSERNVELYVSLAPSVSALLTV
jgi:hypothetical protein